ncbi:U4/U6 small nuclear ribonucleoprotein Prp31-like isoform X3 [Carassius gibelio]|uniref:U4/U6 small nuclear ribonucleoprotein Prp31-like isoform X3 n=1 Tax=Carassius gibelio TaxID=101364 RepID=UPI0022798F8F|nr:U4/U6 small nuclear ribonucleoprotein Prp31-like isoform X3 [Carassius gibelio]
MRSFLTTFPRSLRFKACDAFKLRPLRVSLSTVASWLIFACFIQVGYDLKEGIERKFDKWQEHPPVKQVKFLPAPLDGQRKKSGGRRYCKMKERLGLTEIRKYANRMTFAEIEDDAYQEDLGFSLSQMGKSGSGRVRQAQVNDSTKARISKSLQGLEIVNPQAAEKVAEANQKYFSNMAEFLKVKREKEDKV